MMYDIVLMNWARPKNVNYLIEHYSKMVSVSKIIVINNNSNDTELCAKLQPKEVRVNISEDLGLFTRFAFACLSRKDAIFLVDDDILLPEETLLFLYNEWTKQPDTIHTLVGRNVENNQYSKLPVFEGKCDISLTRCCVTTPEMCAKALKYAKNFVNELNGSPIGNGEDILISFVAGKSIAYRLPREELPANDGIHKRPGHYEYRTKAVNWCQKNVIVS